VLDVETTGVYNKDRVVEIAVVTIDRDGQIIDEFETLVNPGRDVGPTHIHHVTAAMVADAPRFIEIAPYVAARLDGAICAAHNLPFDRRMVSNEFVLAGLDLKWGQGLDTLRLTGCKLGVACLEHGVAHSDAHSALGDARATAALLLAVANMFDGEVLPASAPPLQLGVPRLHTRSGTSTTSTAPAHFVTELAAGIHSAPDVAPYVALLDEVLDDLRITPEERIELLSLALELGLTPERMRQAHADFIHALIDSAITDHVVTDDEYDQLLRAAALLEVDPAVVSQRTDRYRTENVTLTLGDGLTVCFTGTADDEGGRELDRDTLEQLARHHGLRQVSSVTKSACQLVVAADAESRSSKAVKARQYGIPIISAAQFVGAIEGDGSVTATRSVPGLISLVCGRCGTSWTAKRKSSKALCAACKKTAA